MNDGMKTGTIPEWTYEGYRNTVLGTKRACDIVFEFEMRDTTGLDEWLGHAEEAAMSAGGIKELPSGWSDFHERARNELRMAIEQNADLVTFTVEGL